MHICITNLNPSKLRRYKIKKNTKFSFFSLSPFLSLLLSFSNKFKSFPIKVAKNLKKQNSNTNSIVKNYSLSLSLLFPSHDLFPRKQKERGSNQTLPGRISPLRSQISVRNPRKVGRRRRRRVSIPSSSKEGIFPLSFPSPLICAVKSVFPDRRTHEIFTKRLATAATL